MTDRWWRALALVVVLALVVGGPVACGIQAPRATVAVSDDRILEVDGPSIRGSVSSPDGVEVAGGAIWLNPAAAVAEGVRLLGAGIGQLLGLVDTEASESAAP